MKVIVLGIGQHLNLNELADMVVFLKCFVYLLKLMLTKQLLKTNDSEYVFENLTSPLTMERFAETFRQTTITDECEYLRGPEGNFSIVIHSIKVFII